MSAEARKAKITELREQGISVPEWVHGHLESDIAPTAVREQWLGWSMLWDRPRASTWPQNASLLPLVQDEWDKSHQHVTAMGELAAERKKREAQTQKEREDRIEAKRLEDADKVKQELRRKYLSLPGASNEEFETDFPSLLADHRRQEMGRVDEEARRSMQSIIRKSL